MITPTPLDDSKMACVCFHITIGDLRKAVEDGAATYQDIVAMTKAATACGLCAPLIQKYMDRILAGE